MITNQILVHHTVTPQDEDKWRAYDRVKKAHISRGLISSNGNIAYHYLIGKDWTIVDGGVNEIRYHAGHFLTNLTSVAIAIVGNFNVDQPTKYQEQELKRIIGQLNASYGPLEVRLHREVRRTACPGHNVTKDYLNGILNDMDKKERAKYEEKIRELNTEIGRVTAERDNLRDIGRDLKKEIASHKETVEKYEAEQQAHQKEIDKRRRAEKKLRLCEENRFGDLSLLEVVKLWMRTRNNA